MPERRPEEWEIVRRSIAMLTPAQPASLDDREAALELLDDLQRLQRTNKRLIGLFEQLRALVDGYAAQS
jgi:hypothetical protein